MGCKNSKVINSEVSWRCRKRKRMMGDAANYRQQFAAAHLAYVNILGNVGHALSLYADRQLSDLQVVPASSSAQNPGSVAKPAASKPPPHIYLKPPSSSSKLPAEAPASVAPTPLQPGLSHLNSDAKVTENGPTAQENLEPATSYGSSALNLELLGQGLSGDVLMSSMPPSPIGGPSPYVWSQPSSPLNSGWDPFNLFAAVTPRLPDLTSGHLQDWDSAFQTSDYVDVDGLPELEEDEADYVDVDGLPELEEDEADVKREDYEASQSTVVPSPEKAKAMEGSVKPEKMRTEANMEKVLETIDEESSETGEGSSEGATLEIQKKGASQKVKNPANSKIDSVKQISECVVRIEDAFARAAESGREVSDMLETRIVHPPMRTSFTDSFRLGRSRSGRWSRKSSPSQIIFEGSDDDEWKHDSHALTLEKLYTWEKKLFKEVKVGDQLHIAFSRKSMEFRSVYSKGKDPDLIEECRADMKTLESQLVVAFRAISTASLQIQKLSTEELYPQLIELLKRLKTMWKAMLECHTAQKAIALEILTIKESGQKFAASDAHRRASVELENQLETWQQCFDRWMVAQQRYIGALLAWIRICHMEPEPSLGQSNDTPPALPAATKAPIYELSLHWENSFLRLKENNNVVVAINKFVGRVHHSQLNESEELAETKRAEMQSRSIDFRSRKGSMQGDKNTIIIVQREDAVLLSLQQHLPAIFEALTTFSSVACEEYEKLHGGAGTSTEE